MEKNNFELGEKKAVNNNEVWGDAKPCGSSQTRSATLLVVNWLVYVQDANFIIFPSWT